MVVGRVLEVGCCGVKRLIHSLLRCELVSPHRTTSFLLKLTVVVFLLHSLHARADTSSAGQIIREARCKVLIRGPVPALPGDVLSVTRRPQGQGALVGQVKLLKRKDTRATAVVVDGRADCRKFVAAYVNFSSPSSTSPGKEKGTPLRLRSGPPTLPRLVIGGGPGLFNTNLKGTSREVPALGNVEEYPLILASLNVFGEIYPLMFGSGSAGRTQWLGVEGLFRYIVSSSPVQVAAPMPRTGEELNLELDIKRITSRGGVVIRAPIWKERVFTDIRSGYYFSRLTSSIVKFTKTPADKPTPFEMSPLRDLGVSGVHGLAGIQFQPVNAFRFRLNLGTVFAPNYQVDNRPIDATASSPFANAKVDNPKVFLLESSAGYSLKSFQLGLWLSVENFAGTAYFPDGQTLGDMGESYLSYGLGLAFLL